MIWYFVVEAVIQTINVLFDAIHLPKVMALPTIMGVNLDSSLQTAVGTFIDVTSAFWPLHDLFVAALFYIGYLVLKNLALRFILGNRAPA